MDFRPTVRFDYVVLNFPISLFCLLVRVLFRFQSVSIRVETHKKVISTALPQCTIYRAGRCCYNVLFTRVDFTSYELALWRGFWLRFLWSSLLFPPGAIGISDSAVGRRRRAPSYFVIPEFPFSYGRFRTPFLHAKYGTLSLQTNDFQST